MVQTLPPAPTDQGLPNTPPYGTDGSLSPTDPSFYQPGPFEHYQKESRFEQLPGSRVPLPIAPPPSQSTQPAAPPVPSGPEIQPTYPNPPSQGPPIPPTFPTPFYPFGPNAQNGPQNYGQPTCAVVSLVPPIFKRIVRIQSSRVGVIPQIPIPADLLDMSGQTMNQYLLSSTIAPKATQYTSDGQPVYGISAEYVYVLDRPPSLASLPVGISEPWNNGGQGYGWTGPQLFAQDSIGDGTTQINPA